MEFDQPCVEDAADGGSMNVFDVRYVDEITVIGSATDDNLWGGSPSPNMTSPLPDLEARDEEQALELVGGVALSAWVFG